MRFGDSVTIKVQYVHKKDSDGDSDDDSNDEEDSNGIINLISSVSHL